MNARGYVTGASRSSFSCRPKSHLPESILRLVNGIGQTAFSRRYRLTQ